MPGVDWVFDGGLPTFGAILFCGKEGTGKSTFAWELLTQHAKRNVETLYISSEQSPKDIRRQFSRCGAVPAKHMTVYSEIDYESILDVIEQIEPQILVLDSIHEVENVTDEDGVPLASGHPNAVTRIAKVMRRRCGERQCLALLVGHVNNDGTLKGGSNLRHAVDATLVLGRNDDQDDPRRFLGFQGKSRFGRLGRRALFVMGEDGIKDRGPLKEDTSPEPRKKDFGIN